jgi:TRAP-type C4-dicarboxylate transport system substrate-binding protein
MRFKIAVLTFLALILTVAGATQPRAEILHEFDFVMAHKPDNEQNVALIKEFTQKVFDRTGGAVKINAVNYGGETRGQPTDSINSIPASVYTGEIGMSQIAIKLFSRYSDTMEALNMPMVFRDHDHVEKVVDGDIGKSIIDDLYKSTDGQIQGLAFTYSGGFRNIFTTGKAVTSVADLNGMKMRYRSNPGGRDAVHYLGLDQDVALNFGWEKKIAEGAVLAEEAETLRLLTYDNMQPEIVENTKSVLVTNHSVYLTLIALHGPLFESLSPEHRLILQEEADNLSEKERQLSIQQAIDGRKMFEERGIIFVDMSDEDRKALATMGNKVHNKYKGTPVGRVMQDIINTQ